MSGPVDQWRSGYTALYRAFDPAGRLLYVGISENCFLRLSQHAGSPWSCYVKRIELEFYPTRDEAAAAEREAIATEDPVWNIEGRPIRRYMQWMAAYPKDADSISEDELDRLVEEAHAHLRKAY